MASSLGSLVVSLGLDAAQFVDGLTKQERQAKRFVQSVTSNVARIGGTFALIAGAAAAPIAALRAMTGEMDNVSKAALRASMPTEAFSALAYAGELADVSMESLTTTMGRLARAQADAARSSTSQQAEAFKNLGIEIQNADGTLRESSAVFEDFADKFEKFGGTPEVVAAGMQIFGRSFQELIPLLSGGRAGLRDAMEEARAFGVVMSTEAGKQAEAFNDNISRLGLALLGMKRQIVSEALPAAVMLTDEFVKLAKEVTGADGVLRQLTSDGTIRGWAETGALAIARIGESLYFVAKAAGVVGSAFKAAWADIQLGQAASRNLFGGFLFESNRKALSDALASRNKTVEEFNGQLNDLINYDGAKLSRTLEESFGNKRMGGMVGLNAKIFDRGRKPAGLPGGGGGGGGAGKAADEAARYLESLQKQLEATKDLSVEEQLLTDIRMGRLGKVSEGQQAELQAVARQIDQARAAKALFEEEARAKQAAFELSQRRGEAAIQEADALVLSNQQLRDEIAAIGLNAEERAKLEQQILSTAIARKEEALVMAQNAGATDAEITALRRQIELLKERRDLLGKKGAAEGVAEAAKEADEFAKSLGMTFSSAFEDAIVSGNNLRDVLKGLEQDILRIITRKLVTEPLANALGNMMSGGSGGGGGGFLASIFGSLFGGGKAAGGPVQAGRFYEVNERRSELLSVGGRDFLMAGAAGRVRPNPALAQAAQPMTVHMTVVAQDVESFRRSEAQVTTRLGMALNRGRRFG